MSGREAFGLGHVALRVRDLRAMEAFYVGQLGRAVVWREGAGTEGAALHLERGPDRLVLRLDEAIARRGALLQLGLRYEKPSDVDAAHRRLEAAGTRVLSPPAQTVDGGYAAEVADPEGNTVLLYSR